MFRSEKRIMAEIENKKQSEKLYKEHDGRSKEKIHSKINMSSSGMFHHDTPQDQPKIEKNCGACNIL